MPLSVVLITRNEEANVARCLASVRALAAEIVVVDSGSTDRTVEICQQLGCRVLHRPFDGYGAQKRFAVAQARHDWVLSLDADEELTPALRDELARVLASPPAVSGFLLPRSLVFMNKLLRFGGQYRSPVLRLFDRRAGTFNENLVHENIELTGPTRTLRHHLLHYSYDSIESYLTRFNAYTSAGARELHARGRRGSVWQVAFRLPITFFSIYVLKGSALDGYPGFVWALLSAYYPVVKYIKLRELYAQHSPPKP